MFENFTEPARRVIFRARLVAGRSGSEFIEPEHLLRGLVDEDQGDSGTAGKIRMSAHQYTPPPSQPYFSGEQAERLRQMITGLDNPSESKPHTQDMPLAPGAKRAIEAAIENAGTSRVTLLHLLLALQSDEGSSVANLLASVGITRAQIEDAIQKQ